MQRTKHTVGIGGSTIGTTGPGYGFSIGFGVRGRGHELDCGLQEGCHVGGRSLS